MAARRLPDQINVQDIINAIRGVLRLRPLYGRSLGPGDGAKYLETRPNPSSLRPGTGRDTVMRELDWSWKPNG